jgi:hypothetical protein
MAAESSILSSGFAPKLAASRTAAGHMNWLRKAIATATIVDSYKILVFLGFLI